MVITWLELFRDHPVDGNSHAFDNGQNDSSCSRGEGGREGGGREGEGGERGKKE